MLCGLCFVHGIVGPQFPVTVGIPVHKFGSQHAILFVKRARRSSIGGRIFVAVVSISRTCALVVAAARDAESRRQSAVYCLLLGLGRRQIRITIVKI